MKRLAIATAKMLVEKVPACIGTRVSALPFRYRLGTSYDRIVSGISEFEILPAAEKEDVIFRHFSHLVHMAYEKIPFYKDFYREHGFTPRDLGSFGDISKVPIVKKENLQRWPLISRQQDGMSGRVMNTGGTSGQPLNLVQDNGAYQREWAHMHTIWRQLGYRSDQIKLTVRGRDIGPNPLKYNFTQNEFQVNAVCELDDLYDALRSILRKYKISYLHGYPSAIYELTSSLHHDDQDLLGALKLNLKGIFLGSEYPAPPYRKLISEVWDVPTLSWYGHTEMAVLAPERDEPYLYYPFQTYGYAEAEIIDGAHHLIGTTLHNQVGPLIRYDTGDLIEPVAFEGDVLRSFRIKEGRIGDFVTDLSGRRIALTALIFGRHHKLFEVAEFIQIRQKIPGEITVYITSRGDIPCPSDLFNSSDINMKIEFEIVQSPIRSKLGKTPLLLHNV
ncbi:MAG: hypothetical protein ISR50_10005 [Alphaproteobacteria bacterium]|nr:hypothetical protein [Alphaproteobacteria bacterium]